MNTNMSEVRSWNIRIIMEQNIYGEKIDFIQDDMEKCLAENIISKEASEDPIWNELGIEIINCDRVQARKCPRLLYQPKIYWDDYTDDNKVAKYQFRKVVLPEGWSLKKGCGCSRKMNPSSFILCDQNGKEQKTLTYFPNFDLKNSKSKWGRMAGFF